MMVAKRMTPESTSAAAARRMAVGKKKRGGGNMYDSTSSQKYGLITLVARISDVPEGFSGSGGGGGGGSSSSSSKQQTAAPEGDTDPGGLLRFYPLVIILLTSLFR